MPSWSWETDGLQRSVFMRIQLSDHFNYKRLLRFVLPSVIMMICTSMYSIVDGFFVSNFAGKTSFAAVNLIFPVSMAQGTVGMMIGTGGSAIISKTLGEGKKELANRYFSMLVCFAVAVSLLLTVASLFLTDFIVSLLGAEGELKDCGIIYGKILFAAQTTFVLQIMFQSFFVTAEKPELSLKISVLTGLTNMALDFLFIAVFHWGIGGAGLATIVGQTVGGIIPLIYFSGENDSLLRFSFPGYRIDWRMILKACANGASEMVTNLSSSVVNILYNFQLMRLAGENGIAAYGVIMYVNFVFAAVFLGYSMGSAPVVGYHYGAGNREELKNLFRKSICLLSVTGITMTVLAELLNASLVNMFVGYDTELFEMTCHGFRLYALMFTVTGISIWGSAFFTALNDGPVSAAISFLRTLVFQIGAILILPVFLKLDGIWLGVVAAEYLAAAVTVMFFVKNRRKYGYA